MKGSVTVSAKKSTKIKVSNIDEGFYKGTVDNIDGLFIKKQQLVHLDNDLMAWNANDEVECYLDPLDLVITTD